MPSSVPALVLGSADCLEDDLALLEELAGGPWPGTVIAVNDAGWAYPHRIHHWVSLHPKKFHEVAEDGVGDWIEARRKRGHSMDFTTWGGIWRTGMHDTGLVDCLLPCVAVGSSGFHAVMVALHLGCAPGSCLAGMPMDFRPHFTDEHPKPWNSAAGHQEAWRDWSAVLKPRFRSPSGWTQELLGAPTAAWVSRAAA